MTIQNYSMISGDSKSIDISLVDNDGAAVDVSTAGTATYKIASGPNADSVVYVTKSLVSGITVATSTVTVALVPSDTENLSGAYYHELLIVDAEGKQFRPIQGKVTITRNLI